MSVDLSLGTVDGMNQTIDNTGGSGVTLPSANTSDAGLMPAADKKKVNEILTTSGIKNATSASNSEIVMNSTGTEISRNVSDTNSTLVVNQISGPATGNIQTWQKASTPKSYIRPDGSFKADNGPNGTTIRVDASVSNVCITASTMYAWSRGLMFRNAADTATLAGYGVWGWDTTSYDYGWMGLSYDNAAVKWNNIGLGIGLTGSTAPSYPLHLDIGTVTGAKVLAYFSQNGGTVKLSNSSSAANEFKPSIVGAASNVSDAGLSLIGQGSNTYSSGAITLVAKNAAGTGSVSGGNTFQLVNNATPQLTVDYTGVVKIADLAGTGTRMVTADSAGTLDSVASIPVANGGTGLTSAGTNGQILVSDGTGFVLTTPPDIVSGAYTPTVTVGVGTVTPSGFTFMKIKDIVNVNGLIDCSGIIAGVNDLKVTLPVASSFSANEQLNGVITGTDLKAASPNYVLGDANTGEAHVSFHAVGGTATVYIQFQYQVL